MIHERIIFREIGGTWRRVDSQEPKPPILADYENQLGIVIDENAQFCRIKKYYEKYTKTIEYRVYGGKITIDIYLIDE